MPEKSYLIFLDVDVRKRHFHKTERGQIVDFVVQFEVKTAEGNWQAVIRYDCAHDHAHCDRFTLKGEQKKEELRLDYAEALVVADDDIDDHWQEYRDRFLKGGFP